MTDDLKAAIERTKQHECCSLAEYDTVMALAEIGRLAVEFYGIDVGNAQRGIRIKVARELQAAADAFLAERGKQ